MTSVRRPWSVVRSTCKPTPEFCGASAPDRLVHVTATDNGQLTTDHRQRYLSFNVVSAKSAKTSAAIQKRAMTLDSFHPSNSKW